MREREGGPEEDALPEALLPEETAPEIFSFFC